MSSRWEEVGAYLKGKAPKPTPAKKVTPYEEMGLEELKSKQQIAKEWLLTNKGHKQYQEAKRRLDQIEAEITYRISIEVFGKENEA